MRYAISDVTLLLPLMDRLEATLVREGRAELAQECFRVIPTLAKLDLAGFLALRALMPGVRASGGLGGAQPPDTVPRTLARS